MRLPLCKQKKKKEDPKKPVFNGTISIDQNTYIYRYIYHFCIKTKRYAVGSVMTVSIRGIFSNAVSNTRQVLKKYIYICINKKTLVRKRASMDSFYILCVYNYMPYI